LKSEEQTSLAEENFASPWFETAFQEAIAYLRKIAGNLSELSKVDLEFYGNDRFFKGLRFSLLCGQEFQNFDILFDSRYPFSLPKFAMVDKDHFLRWPHIEENGEICLVPSHVTFVHAIGTSVLESLCAALKQLIIECRSGINQSHFVEEFHSYWNRMVDQFRPIIAIVPLQKESRKIWAWKGIKFTLLAETPSSGVVWLQNYFGKQTVYEDNFFQTAYIHLNSPLFPKDYPTSGPKLRKLINSLPDGGKAHLWPIFNKIVSNHPIAFGFTTANGPALFGLSITEDKPQKVYKKSRGDHRTRGFRPRKIPFNILLNRALGASSIVAPCKIKRADPLWLHSRGGSGLRGLDRKKVVLIGCGSLGSSIAMALAQAGIGKLMLIDPEKLEWNNIARHELGAQNIGETKVLALAKIIKGHLPHVEVEGINSTWEKIFERTPVFMQDADLVISTTADWNSNSLLNLRARTGITWPPILYGWTEAFGLAGHALYVSDRGGCLACGSDGVGNFLKAITAWPSHLSTLQQEPACGAFYQPYGVLDTQHIRTLIAEAALDVLLGKAPVGFHRIWVGEVEKCNETGGELSSFALSDLERIGSGRRRIDSPWPINPNCTLCN
jgi:ubiquitin-protein ligase